MGRREDIQDLLKRIEASLEDKDLDMTQVSVEVKTDQAVIMHWRMFASVPDPIEVKLDAGKNRIKSS